LSCLLLLCIDRVRSTKLNVTNANLASMLGVRRESVSVAIGGMKQAGLLGSERSHLAVLDRPGLELHSCECYAAIRKQHDLLRPRQRDTGKPVS
jgi:Mn-dependent DtxR family transcriptional regulator